MIKTMSLLFGSIFPMRTAVYGADYVKLEWKAAQGKSDAMRKLS